MKKSYRIETPKTDNGIRKIPMSDRVLEALQYLMGHANITMTLNYYAHATFDSAQAEFFRLAA